MCSLAIPVRMSCCGGHSHEHGQAEADHQHHEPSDEEIAEMNHFNEIVASFNNYTIDSIAGVPVDKKTRTAIDVNAVLTSAIVADSGSLFGNSDGDAGGVATQPTAERNISKVRSTLKQFVREWSSEGKAERDASFTILIEALQRHLPVTDRSPFVICPGSGLGRLPYEIAKAGYNAQGNEFSYHMILGSHFILNSARLAPESVVIFPYCLNYTHSRSEQSRLRPVRIPDEVPSRTSGQMSMCAGEFVETYEKQGYEIADGVVTCFFIDTAKNILLYIRTIAGMLKPGGIWANLGPLLFHYAEHDDEVSIELSWEEIRELLKEYFELVEEKTGIDCVYSGNKESMIETQYKCIFFVAKRNSVPVEGFSNPVFP